MEELHDMDCKVDIISSERCKRWLKTPAQVEALENFYNEHKYPSESLKLQFAKKIGLSEKQVSGWFCHRRSKDKRLLQNGKHNLSDGALNDHTSGLRQESCNSTKQGDRHFDTKEVESRRFYGQNSSAVLSSELMGAPVHVECCATDDRSSRSSSASQGMLLRHDIDPCAMEPFRYSNSDRSDMLMNSKTVKRRGHMMDTRCSYMQAGIENPAVSLVKHNLGNQYCEDGPPLGVDFDALPPGAFDSPVRDSNFEPYFVGDSIPQRSCSIPMIIKEPKMYEKYRCEAVSNSLHSEGYGHRRTIQEFNHQNEIIGRKLTSKGHPKHNHHPLNQTIVKDKGVDCVGETSDHNSRKNGRCLKYRVEGKSDNSVGHLFHRYGMKAKKNKSLPYPNLDKNYCTPVFQRENFGSKFSKPALQSNELSNTEHNMKPRRPFKVLKEKVHKERKTHENHNSVRSEMYSRKMCRKVRGKVFQQQDYVMNASEKFPWTKPAIRYSGDIAASSSHDESGGTTSSVE